MKKSKSRAASVVKRKPGVGKESSLAGVVFVRSPLVLFRRLEAEDLEVQIVRTEDGQIFELDGLLAEAFCELDGRLKLADVVKRIDEDFLNDLKTQSEFEKAWTELVKLELIEML